jgi:hypothetical protein
MRVLQPMHLNKEGGEEHIGRLKSVACSEESGARENERGRENRQARASLSELLVFLIGESKHAKMMIYQHPTSILSPKIYTLAFQFIEIKL